MGFETLVDQIVRTARETAEVSRARRSGVLGQAQQTLTRLQQQASQSSSLADFAARAGIEPMPGLSAMQREAATVPPENEFATALRALAARGLDSPEKVATWAQQQAGSAPSFTALAERVPGLVPGIKPPTLADQDPLLGARAFNARFKPPPISYDGYTMPEFTPAEEIELGLRPSRPLLPQLRWIDREVGRALLSPLTGYSGEVAGEPQYSDAFPLGGDALYQTLPRGFAEESLRPTSLAAMAVPQVRAGGLLGTAAANAALQGGANVGLDLALGRTDPSSLALSATVGGVLGGVTAPGVVSGVREAVQSSPEVRRVATHLAGETGSLRLPGGSEPAETAAETAVEAVDDEAAAVLPASVTRFRDALRASKPLGDEERAALKEAAHATQAAKMGRIGASDLPWQEKRALRSGAQRGRIIPAVTPVKITSSDIDELHNLIESAGASGRITPWEINIGHDALDLLTAGVRTNSRKPLNIMPSERDVLRRALGADTADAIPTTQAGVDRFQQLVHYAGVPRALQASMDISAPGRQGILYLARYPKQWAKAWKPMVKAWKSEAYTTQRMQDMLEDADVQYLRMYGLDLTGIPGKAEEAFVAADVAQRIPGVGRGVKASERAYSMYLDDLRVAVGKQKLRRLEARYGKGNIPGEVMQSVVSGINHATGRGGVGALEDVVPALNAAFFSPKFFASRLQTLSDLVDPRIPWEARKEMWMDVGAFVGLGTSVLATAVAADRMREEFGVPGPRIAVSIDPRNTDFGKIRAGNVRIDFWGGFQPLARAATQFATGQKTVTGLDNPIATARADVIKNFVRSKLSPAGGIVWDAVLNKGKRYPTGSPMTVTDWDSPAGYKGPAVTALRAMTPLVFQAMADGFMESGPAGATVGVVGGTGIGVQAYEGAGGKTPEELVAANMDARVAKMEQQFTEAADASFGTPAWQAAFAEDLGEWGIDPKDAGSLGELKQAFVEKHLAGAVEQGWREVDAKEELQAYFDRLPSVKKFDRKLKAYETRYWREHPDAWREAYDAGYDFRGDDGGLYDAP